MYGLNILVRCTFQPCQDTQKVTENKVTKPGAFIFDSFFQPKVNGAAPFVESFLANIVLDEVFGLETLSFLYLRIS